MTTTEQSERAKKWGYFAGNCTLRFLRREIRYQSMRHTWLTRFIFTRLLPREIYEFRQDPMNPLTFHAPNGVLVRPKERMETDFGSVPRLFQFFIEKDQFPFSFFLHDSAYEDHGLYCCTMTLFLSGETPPWLPATADMPSGIEWRFLAMTREQSDAMLGWTVGAEDGLLFHRRMIWAAVKVGGRGPWEDCDETADERR